MLNNWTDDNTSSPPVGKEDNVRKQNSRQLIRVSNDKEVEDPILKWMETIVN